MRVTEATIKQLGPLLEEQLEADIISALAMRLGIPADEAMSLYYRSSLAQQIEEGRWGMQYLGASYLAEEVLKQAGAQR